MTRGELIEGWPLATGPGVPAVYTLFLATDHLLTAVDMKAIRVAVRATLSGVECFVLPQGAAIEIRTAASRNASVQVEVER